MANALIDARGQLAAKRAKVHEIFEQAGEALDHTKVTSEEFSTGESLRDYLKASEDEMGDLRLKVDDLRDVEKIREQNAKEYMDDRKEAARSKGIVHPESDITEATKGLERMSLGDVAVKSGMFEEGVWNGDQKEYDIKDANPEVLFKTDFTTAAGWDPEDTRIGRVAFDEQRIAPVVSDVFPTFPTSQSTVLYMEETTFTNSAAEAAENAAIAESALAYTERSSEVRKIGHSLPVTIEALEDTAQLRALLDQRLRFMVAQRLDLQLMVGNGTPPNLSGVHDQTSINTQAKGTDSVPDAVYKAITAARVTGFANPNVAIFHPNDWQTVRLLQTADGVYIWGPPSQAGEDRIWGLPVIQTTAETENQAAVGDFAAHSGLFLRRGVQVSVTDSHASEFLDDITRIKMTMRAAVVFFRQGAFSEITGI